MTRDYIISAEVVDRCGDIILQDGIATENFAKNPVCLLEHGWGSKLGRTPIGEWSNIEIVSIDGVKCTKATLQVYDTDATEDVMDIMKQGGYKACSVGLRIRSYDDIDSINTDEGTAWRIVRSELVEVSLCAIPANPRAVALNKGFYREASAAAGETAVEKRKDVALADLRKEMQAGMHPSGCVIYKFFIPQNSENNMQKKEKADTGKDAPGTTETNETPILGNEVNELVKTLRASLDKAVEERNEAIKAADALRKELVELRDAQTFELSKAAADKDAMMRNLEELRQALQAEKSVISALKADNEIQLRLARMHSPKTGHPISLELVREIKDRFKCFYSITYTDGALVVYDIVAGESVKKSLEAIVDDFAKKYYPTEIARGNGLTSEMSAQSVSPEDSNMAFRKALNEAREAGYPMHSETWCNFLIGKGYKDKLSPELLKRFAIA